MDEYIAETEETEEKHPFAVVDDITADWAARTIKEDYAERDRLLELVKAERARLDAREKEIKERYIRKTEYLESQLLSYMASVKTRDTATQSKYELLNATLVYKHPKTDLSPSDGLLAWLEENHPEFVKVTREPDWAGIKKHIIQLGEGVFAMQDTGEVVDGIVPKEVPGKFEVK